MHILSLLSLFLIYAVSSCSFDKKHPSQPKASLTESKCCERETCFNYVGNRCHPTCCIGNLKKRKHRLSAGACSAEVCG